MSAQRLYGLIGYPITHSASPGFFAKKFASEGITDAEYRLFPMEDVHEFQHLIEAGVKGVNVTIPHKQNIIPYLSELDETASAVGAVNCVRIFSDGRTKGYNTDVYGFETSIKPFLENKYERALILGTGGASKAVAFVLKKWNISHFFMSRSPRTPKQLNAAEINAEMLKHFPLIINCTPLGTAGEWANLSPLNDASLEGLTSAHFVYDLVYNPTVTPLLRMAALRGAHTMNGLSMLHLQAEKSYYWWTRED